MTAGLRAHLRRKASCSCALASPLILHPCWPSAPCRGHACTCSLFHGKAGLTRNQRWGEVGFACSANGENTEPWPAERQDNNYFFSLLPPSKLCVVHFVVRDNHASNGRHMQEKNCLFFGVWHQLLLNCQRVKKTEEVEEKKG